ncbi:cyclin2 related protein [Cystoisospora suis]|uniref:Cyclin2 related protein n=1 Tax=Cystoisospora suis TaxID=483139 RepID=A0A2C6KDZ2_9APIC|nr:cyclin2 related protein [Cystoisospora suis]
MEETGMPKCGEGMAGGGDTNSCGSRSSRCTAPSSYDLQLGAEAGTTDDSFVPSLATVLHHLVSISPPDLGEVTSFHAIKEPQISIHDYLERIAKYFGCSNECFVLSLVYIDRILKLHRDFNVSILNIHRLLITSVMLAAKFFDDVYYSNKHYARVGGVRTREINLLETQFLTLINYHLFVSPQEYDQYRRNVLAAVHYARNLSSGPSRFSAESSSAGNGSAPAGETAQLEAPHRQEQPRPTSACQHTERLGDRTTAIAESTQQEGIAAESGGVGDRGCVEYGGDGVERSRGEAAVPSGGRTGNSSSRPRSAKSFTGPSNSSPAPADDSESFSGVGSERNCTAPLGNSHSNVCVRQGSGMCDHHHGGRRIEEKTMTASRASPPNDTHTPSQSSACSGQHCRQEDSLSTACVNCGQGIRPSLWSRSSHRWRSDFNGSRHPSLPAETAGDHAAEVEAGVARTPRRVENHLKKQEGSSDNRGTITFDAREELRDYRNNGVGVAEEEAMPSARRRPESRRQTQADYNDVEQRVSYRVEAAEWSESRAEEDDGYYGRQKECRAVSVAVEEEESWVEEEVMDTPVGSAGEARGSIAASSRHSPAHTDYRCFEYLRAPTQDQSHGKPECKCCNLPVKASLISVSSGPGVSCLSCEGPVMATSSCTPCGCTGADCGGGIHGRGEGCGRGDGMSGRGPSEQSQHNECSTRCSLSEGDVSVVESFNKEIMVAMHGLVSSDAGSRARGVLPSSGDVVGVLGSDERGQKSSDQQPYTSVTVSGAEIPASSSSTSCGSSNGTTQSSVSSCLTPSHSMHSSPDVSMDDEVGVSVAGAAGAALSAPGAVRVTGEDTVGEDMSRFFARRIERTSSSTPSASAPGAQRNRTMEFPRGGSVEERGDSKQRRSWGPSGGRQGQLVYAPSVPSTCPSRGGALSFTAATVGGAGGFPGPTAAGLPSGSCCLPYGPC